jgi:hypothetical protein
MAKIVRGFPVTQLWSHSYHGPTIVKIPILPVAATMLLFSRYQCFAYSTSNGEIKLLRLHIVTCPPILGLGNRALLGNRPVNKTSAQTRWRHAMYSNTVSTQHAAVTSHDTGVGEYRVTFAFPRVTQQALTWLVAPIRIVNTPSRQQWRSYDWGLYKRNWNV